MCYLDVRRTKCKSIFIALQKCEQGMALRVEWAAKVGPGIGHKEGAARGDERPKSREETPKVGHDT